MQLQPYLYFNGDCETAFKYYERVLGGKIEAMMSHAGTPAEQHVPAEWRNKILHARLVGGAAVLMASDAPPGRFHKPQGFSVPIQINDTARAGDRFRPFAAGRPVTLPFRETFLAARFGCLVAKTPRSLTLS